MLFDQERIISSNLGYGADVSWKIMWERFYLGVSYEAIQGKEDSYLYSSDTDVRIPTTEGFDLKLIELTGYYIVPISSEDIQFYMGGGFGLYDGNRNSSIAGIKPATVESSNNIGIHVLTGIVYSITNSIGLRGEIKFRDPHFDVTEKYERAFVDHAGFRIYLNQNPTKTRVNLYGINYMVGIVYQI